LHVPAPVIISKIARCAFAREKDDKNN